MNLHGQIMNLPQCDPGLEADPQRAYKLGHRDARHAAAELALAADAEIERLREALTRIAKWHGEFPATGLFWDEPANTRPMSHSAAFGSTGERDYMRQVAAQALGMAPW